MIVRLLYKLKLILPQWFKDILIPLTPTNLISALKGDDYFIVSFPKCGRSWLKLILCDMVYFEFPDKTRIDDVSTEYLNKIDKRIPRIIFTHDRNPMYKTVEELTRDKTVYNKSNVIFLIRDPRDVMVSWFHEYKDRVSSESKHADMFEDNLSNFIRNERGGLKTLVAFYNIWLEEKSNIKNFMIVKYENLKTSSVETITEMNNFLGISDIISDSSIEMAIDKNTFEKVKARELADKIVSGKNKMKEFGAGRNQALKARRGKIGGYRDSLSEDDINWVNNYIQENLHPDFGY